MKSAVAEKATQEMAEAMRRLTPTQRLAAFVEHSRLMALLVIEGQQLRIGEQQRRAGKTK